MGKNKEPDSRRLNFWDAASIIIGIVVGTAVFRLPAMIFQNTSGPGEALLVWVAGGVLCLFGALCYAELGTTYPRNGGDYEYLSRTYGRGSGFLFGWAQLTVILTGSIAAMAYAFSDYAAELWAISDATKASLAAGVVLLLTVMNGFGIVFGKSVQNVLTAAKVLGLLAVATAGIFQGSSEHLRIDPGAAQATAVGWSQLGLALVFVLYAFGGWNDSVFVAAEVRDLKKNLPRALLLGIGGITLVYLAVNASYLAVLGFEDARNCFTPAAEVATRAVGSWGGAAVSVLVMISALGAINGMILTGAHVYSTLGEDYRLFEILSRENRKSGASLFALGTQATCALGLIGAVGTETGRRLIDASLHQVGLSGLPWAEYFGGFETLVAGTAPVFWCFFLMTGIAVFPLRTLDGERERPFRIPLYPLPPLVFCATCIYMLYSSLVYAKWLSLLGFVPLAVGVPLYFLSGRRDRSDGDEHESG